VLGLSRPVRFLFLYVRTDINLLLAENDTRTVINHNPLPDITHEEFVSLLGPLLIPENYMFSSPLTSPTLPTAPGTSTSTSSPMLTPNNSPAPFDWIHFEGRSVKTTLSNITGLDGLARERKWRSHCVFSVDVGRRSRQGIEAVSLLYLLHGLKYKLKTNSELANSLCLAHPSRRRPIS
jgi:hypothetical protein